MGIATTAGTLSLSDPSQFETAVQPWDVICSPLTRAPFRYRMAYVKTPSVIFYRERYETSVSLKGTAPPGMLAFAVPLSVGPDSEFWKLRLERAGFPGTMPGSLDVIFAAGHDHIVVLIALDRMRQILAPDVVSNLEAAAHHRLLPSTRQAVDTLGRWLRERLDTLVGSPELLRESLFRRSLEEDLLQRLANAVNCADSPAARPAASSRRRALERALTYLYGDGESLLTVPELCQIAGASQRTLEYAFRETFDMSPRMFLMQRRLHAVRRALVATDSAENPTVGAIAHAHGFHELGRFAGEYQQAFGELPSQTLRTARGAKSRNVLLSRPAPDEVRRSR